MKILRVDNNYKTSFNARFPQEEVIDLIKIADADNSMINLGNLPIRAGIPKLYALLQRLDKQPGKFAKFVSDSTTHKLYVGDVLISEGSGTKLDVLCSAMTDYKIEGEKSIPLPLEVLNKMWLRYADKSDKDVKMMGLKN